jgi:hypothetical protein
VTVQSFPQQDLDIGLAADPFAGRLTTRAIQIVQGNPQRHLL